LKDGVPEFEVLPVPLRRVSSLAILLALAAGPAIAQDVTGSIGDTRVRVASASVDVGLLREAIARAERGDAAGATERANRLGDPTARKLVDWFLLRAGGEGVTSQRILRFVAENPSWPGDVQLRNRAEAQLASENRPAAEVIAFFGRREPRTANGRLALATALRAQGNTEQAHRVVREMWRTSSFAASFEDRVRERFPGVVTRADEQARMQRLLFDEETGDALRVARRLGGADLAIAQARIAIINRAGNAGALLNGVPEAARSDASYHFARVQFLRRAERWREAAQAILAAPRDPRVLVDPDSWWVERRLVGRALLEEGDARTAYRVFAGHSARRDVDRMEAEFHAGWVALRFLQDPGTADQHFARLQGDAVRSISAARASYWRGRAAEAQGNGFGAQGHFEAAARHRTTFYGQLAMAKIGRADLTVGGSPRVDDGTRARFERRDVVRAIRLLHQAGMSDKARPFFREASEEWTDAEELALLARLGGELGQVRYLLLVGKNALARGIPLESYAFPTNGVPNVPSAGNQVERAVVLGLARQESTFDPVIRSSAGAVGLMQMLPGSAAQTARRYGVAWNPGQLTNAEYNTRLGQAYLGEVIQEFGGSYILAFAAYNAGRGRVREWIQRFGDPRDPRVDPVDWIERIPFSETRNYVMRVMENTQVYRARLSGSTARLGIDRDIRRRGGMGPAASSE
jgi:soluble lytic murein transglycosylase